MFSLSHYQERLDRDLQEIRQRVRSAACLVRKQVGDAVEALLSHDDPRANWVILKDRMVNRATRELDQLCHRFVVRHLPVGYHLRFVSAVLRVDVALERVGDYAVTVCRHAREHSGPPPKELARDFELISQQARAALDDALRSFEEQDPDLARKTLGLAYPVEATHDKAMEDLVGLGERYRVPLKDLFGYLKALYVLLRVAEQAENIAQETLFAVAGETRNPKIYRILFVDRHNDCVSLLAEAYARKTFADCGVFSSGGWEPAETVSPAALRFLEEHGLVAEGLRPKKIPDLAAVPRHFHVIVGLDPGTRSKIGEIPYKTVFLDWEPGPCPLPGDPEASTRLEQIYRGITARMSELMEILRGSHAG